MSDADVAADIDFVDTVPTRIMSTTGTVTKETPRDTAGFAVNILPEGAPAGFVEAVVDWFDARVDPDDFDDRTPVGVVVVDADDPSTVMPVCLHDTVVVDLPADFEQDTATGTVAIVSRSGSLRLRGIGAVDVEPTDVLEVTDRHFDAIAGD